MKKLNTILSVEDDPSDVELTVNALADHNLANDIMMIN
jgi:hypothetical protein